MRTFTVDNYPMLKPRIGRVGEKEEDVHEPDQSDFAGPLLSIDRDFPRVNVTELLEWAICENIASCTYVSHSRVLSLTDLP
jgi:hypothetical protein